MVSEHGIGEGYVTHKDFAASIDGTENVALLIKENFVTIKSAFNVSKKADQNAMKKLAAEKLLCDNKLKVVFFAAEKNGALIGVCMRNVQRKATSEEKMLQQYLLCLYRSWYCVAGWCKKKGFHKIAVYTEKVARNTRNLIDTCLISELAADSDLEVLTITDTMTSPGNLPIINSADMLQVDADVIIVADNQYKDKVIYTYNEKMKGRIISLLEIFNEVYTAEVSESEMIETLVS